MTTFRKPPTANFDTESVIKLIAVSTTLYSSTSHYKKKYKFKLNLDLERIKMLTVMWLKSKASTRWYSDFRIVNCDTDEDIKKVFFWTKHLSKGRFLLPQVLDCNDMIRHLEL